MCTIQKKLRIFPIFNSNKLLEIYTIIHIKGLLSIFICSSDLFLDVKIPTLKFSALDILKLPLQRSYENLSLDQDLAASIIPTDVSPLRNQAACIVQFISRVFLIESQFLNPFPFSRLFPNLPVLQGKLRFQMVAKATINILQ